MPQLEIEQTVAAPGASRLQEFGGQRGFEKSVLRVARVEIVDLGVKTFSIVVLRRIERGERGFIQAGIQINQTAAGRADWTTRKGITGQRAFLR